MKKLANRTKLVLDHQTLRHLTGPAHHAIVGGRPIQSLDGGCPTAVICPPPLTSAACNTNPPGQDVSNKADLVGLSPRLLMIGLSP